MWNEALYETARGRVGSRRLPAAGMERHGQANDPSAGATGATRSRSIRDEALPPKRRLRMLAGLLRALVDEPRPRTFPAVSAANLPPPRGRLEIIRDANGVAHVYAEEEADLFLVVGYLQAADRLYLIDFVRHLGAGRLCELLGNLPAPRGNELVKGKRVADLDAFVRPFDFEGQSERDFARLDGRADACLEAYAEGFNAALHAMRGVYPPEYLAFGAVRSWRPSDCLLAARTCAFVISVTGLENELTFDAVRGTCGDDVARRLYPEAPWENVPTTYRAADAGAPEPPFHVPAGGSNNWVVGAARSESGAPIVANDPHVPLIPLPTFWHHFHLECPRYRVQGGMLPGCPIFGFGHNGHLAWGVTHAFRDSFDLYRIHRSPDAPGTYRTVGGHAPIERHREEHATRSAAKVSLEWETCEHGVIYPGWKHHDGTDLALRVIPSDLARYFEGYLALAEADTVADHRAALERINQGPFDFNHVYAHRNGHFGWQLFGLLPRRRTDGLFVRDADDPAGEWDGFLPFAEMPQRLEPASGFVATANSTVAPGAQDAVFSLVHCEPRYRQRQIDAFLDGRPKHSTASFAALQGRVETDYGVPLRDAMMRCLAGGFPRGGLAARALELLAGWDGSFVVESPAAALFFHTQRGLAHRLAEALLGGDLGMRYANGRRALPRLHRMLLDNADPLRADVERATGQSTTRLVREAFAAAVKQLASHCGGVPEEWRWGLVHRARLGTPLSFLPLVGKRFLALDEAFPGDDYTVSPSRPLEFRGRLYAFVGATSRFICDLAKPEEAWFAHSSGPSGDVSSTFYANLSRPWHRFEYFRSALWSPQEVPDPVERVVIGAAGSDER
jgi:penicillin G amidase